MTRDPLDELSDRLFEAARGERPDPRLERRILEQKARLSSGRLWPAVAGTLLLAAATALVLVGARRSSPSEAGSITAEAPSSPARARTGTPQLVPQQEEERPVPPSPSASAKPADPARSATPAKKARVTSAKLAEELELLKRARAALRSGDAMHSLSLLEDYRNELRGTALRAEATLLHIEALSQAGRTADARAVAQRFVADNPHNPLADRARAFVPPLNGK